MSEFERDFPDIPPSSGTWLYWVVGLVLCLAGIYLISTPGADSRTSGERPTVFMSPVPVPVPSRVDSGPRVLRLGHVDGATSTFQRSLTQFGLRVSELSHGHLSIQPMARYSENGRRLGELDMANLVSQGHLDMTLATTSPLSNLNNSFDVLDLPFLVQTYAQAERVLDGPIGQGMLDGLLAHNLKGLGYLEIGFRIFSTTQPMPDLASFKNKRVRVMESPTCLRMARAMGAQGIACPPDRVYSMVKAGSLDGADRTIPSFWDSKLYEVQPYITKTRHLYSAKAILINKTLYDSLSPEDQHALNQAASEMVVSHRQLQRAEEERVEEHCRERSITLFEPGAAQQEAFVKACQPLYDDYRRSRSRDLLDLVEKTPH